ncbi:MULTISPECIES: TIGR04104 family putative zinc finger protein [Geobacillus]|nr:MULTISPECIES: TIGR04104 family putative zinc finger protein [Geobacillus]ARP44222.1 hypothetical protein GTHT12_02726 [Geobacillus thermodenitrificans]KQB91757.1 hypothetical protein GEPA3_3286 [Geobacillus sp. PA-3]MEC5188006.1 CXXC-20-CXXC protein [Geobacillus thermodenitrificans]MED3718115.1 hypothetical protein [Geobacillus thermodenitrificans]MED3907289.1 hypothetical protein [Geobacillus thermodenitrificans]
MPICQHCKKQWTWRQTFCRMFTLGTKLMCPYCQNKQYYSARSRRRNGVFNLVSPLILFLSLSFNVSLLTAIALMVMGTLLSLMIQPFFIELSNQEEPLW